MRGEGLVLTNTWHVSKQTPTRDLSFTRAMISRRSSNVDPITFRPTIVSRTILTVRVSWCARLSADAIRVIPSSRGCGPGQPGLQNDRKISSMTAKAV